MGTVSVPHGYCTPQQYCKCASQVLHTLGCTLCVIHGYCGCVSLVLHMFYTECLRIFVDQLYSPKVTQERKGAITKRCQINLIRTGGAFSTFLGFWPIAFEVIKLNIRNFVTCPKI